MIKLLLSFIIYTLFFYQLGNTIVRTNHNGQKNFSLLPLFTEGIFGPIRTFFILIKNCSFIDVIKYIKFELFRLSNPLSAYIFINYIFFIVKKNCIIY